MPDLDWILEHRAHFDLFHEHVNYFRADDFFRLFGDGVIFQAKSFGGQYLSVVINLECMREPSYSLLQRETNSALQAAFDQLSENEALTYNSLASSPEIVLWGAAAKGVVFAAKSPLEIKRKIIYAIDINPSKQEQFMPLSGVKVANPVSGIAKLNPFTLVVIMNPNYEREIRQSLPHDQPCLVLH